MSNFYSHIVQLSHTIEQSLDNALKTFYEFSCKYKEVLSTLPFFIDLLGESLRSEHLKETAHCRILYKILQNKDMQKNFIEYFLLDISCSWKTIQIPYPDKDRIDLTIKGNTFFLIIENKINGACEQNKQITGMCNL